MVRTITINEFAQTIVNLNHTDRYCMIGTGGFTGEGKSTFTTLLQKNYAKIYNYTTGTIL